MKYLFLLIFVVLPGLQAEELELNLPEKFNVKVSKHWWTENGTKPTEKNAIKEFNRPYVFHFNKSNFIFSDKKHKYSGDEWGSHYQATEGKGTISNDILKGNFITTGFSYTQNNLLHFLWTSKEIISGKVETNGIIHLTGNNITVTKCKMRENKGQGWSSLNACDSTTLSWLTNFLNNVEAHYLLQLPINQSQSSQKFLSGPKPETKEPTQPQPITIPKTNLSVNIFANKETQEESQEKGYLNEAKIEYRKKEKERIAREKAEDLEDLQREKAWEKEDKKEEAHQKMLDDWYEEDRQTNIKYIEGLSGQKKRSKEAEQKENKVFHDNIAKDMQERKTKQAEIKKAHDIVDRFGDNYDSQRLSHKKIEKLSKNADIKKTKAIKNAIRKQYYDSKQTKLQGKAEYQTAKAKEIDKKGNYVKNIKETSLTINKGLAKLDPTGTGDKIVSWQENSYDTIDSYAEGGVNAVIDKFIEKKPVISVEVGQIPPKKR